MRRTIAVFLTGGLLAIHCASYAWAADKWDQQCLTPSPDDNGFIFDDHRLIAGGRLVGTKVLYCVVVQDAPQEYLVYWPAAQMSDVKTRGGIIAQSIDLGTTTQRERTALQIGVNLKKFDVIVPVRQEATNKPLQEYPDGVAWEAVTRFYGSLPINDNSSDYRPVNLEITSRRDSDGRCQLSFVDYDAFAKKSEVSFQLPSEVWSDVYFEEIKQVQDVYSFDKKSGFLSYGYQDKLPQPHLVPLTITNYYGKNLATLPIVACSGDALK